eukprot:TRINITY_DN10937_c0_g1_i2.p1 TRINITY_DN10937_c0_g1~~TRINITY_DN10937_c0_g1_i2.p1  ORF type:complete len:196 (+),score=32.71 TRINITY_DN10937_c0_g1_i2:124-711(+)
MDWDVMEELTAQLRCAMYSHKKGASAEYFFRLLGKDGRVSLREFVFAARRAKLPRSRVSDRQLEYLFGVLDSKGSGSVAVQDVQSVVVDDEEATKNQAVFHHPSPGSLSPSYDQLDGRGGTSHRSPSRGHRAPVVRVSVISKLRGRRPPPLRLEQNEKTRSKSPSPKLGRMFGQKLRLPDPPLPADRPTRDRYVD